MMDIKDSFDKMKSIQNYLLEFIRSEENTDAHFQNLIHEITDQDVFKNQYFMDTFLQIIVKIYTNHKCTSDLFNKIIKILNNYKEEIKALFTNEEIFNIFKSNKRILLYLFEEKIINVDNYIFTEMTNHKYKAMNYDQYFFTELKPFFDSETKNNLSSILPKDYEEKRKIGQNDQYITELIRNDSIDEFIAYVNKNNYQIQSTIQHSIFETNPLFYEKEATLIEYSVYYGSIQIFKYLYLNKVKLTPSLWIYSIHGDNPEIIHILEEQKVKPEDESYRKCYIESIKCYNDDLANYFEKNYLTESNLSEDEKFILFNFDYLDEIEATNETLFYSCKYNYAFIADILLKTANIDINAKFKSFYNDDEILQIQKERAAENCYFHDSYNNYYDNSPDNKILDKKEITKNALIAAIENDNIGIVKLLLSNHNIDVNSESMSSYESEPKNEEEEENDVDIYEREDVIIKEIIKKPALFIAAENQNPVIIKLLLSHPNIDVNSHYTNYNDTNTVNHIQLWDKFDESLSHYEYYHAICNEQKSSLHFAVENNDLKTVELLLSKPEIDVNDLASRNIHEYKDIHVYEKERTALHIAVEKQNIDIINLLLKNPKIDVNIKETSMSYERDRKHDDYNEDKNTALHIAVKENNLKIVQLLLQNSNIDVGSKNFHHYELYSWDGDKNETYMKTALQLAKKRCFHNRYYEYDDLQKKEEVNSQIIEALSSFPYEKEEEENDN